ncbi:MAG: ATP-dependent dethiobiotin synthetase BioD [Elainellaceae cyanobacterium]
MSTLLIAGAAAKAGKSTLAAALNAYWQTRSAGRSLTLFSPAAPFDESSDESAAWLDLAQTWRQLGELSGNNEASSDRSRDDGFVLLELPGELGTPLTPEVTVADLAWDWRLPTVLVVPVAGGMVAQAIAHVALARQSRVHLKGIVLNHRGPAPEAAAQGALIQSLTQIPILGTLPYLTDPTDSAALAAAAAQLDLERLFPMSVLASRLAITS